MKYSTELKIAHNLQYFLLMEADKHDTQTNEAIQYGIKMIEHEIETIAECVRRDSKSGLAGSDQS